MNKFVDKVKGDINVIFTVSHDGHLLPPNIPIRKHGVMVADDQLTETTKIIYQYLVDNKMKPYLVINSVSRKIVDPNRSSKKGCESEQAKLIWEEYHNQIQSCIDDIKQDFNHVYIFDMHGQSTIDAIEIGYGMGKIQLVKYLKHQLVNHQFANLFNRNAYQMIFGKTSIAGVFKQYGIDALPSIKRMPRLRYRRGGYVIKHHSKQNQVVAVQLELSLYARANLDLLKKAVLEIIVNIRKA